MESIERIGPPQQVDIGGPDEHIATMREFRRIIVA